ncbi:hypothetical protein FHS29_004007 [Saccharothrix tamanrassetensis]|uniref:GmrSD restriction endonucleases C-terminal domain-containing protein n=1 Tax=Saccharothrix tamanrassetensis TaxID=1051531 RepID=A0A841CFV3_9PSEU|nr:HNH endonuclease family protein [Saccharothrix tamanrassetensis]MBB5957412.1 hypothetical protein [Saccharothrix tamanrassetensis]
MTYLRHFWSSKQGLTREKDLYSKIKASIATESEVSDFAVQLEHEAVKYAALTNPEHELWKGYDPATRNNMEVLIELNLLPNRPLLLAAIETFEPKEIRSLSARLVNWSVRALTLGTINSGKIEDVYCNVARSIRNSNITTAREVYDNIVDVIAGDAEFEAEFAITRVTKTSLARYYLRSLEKHSRGKEPENVPNPNPDEVNLEHVLPRNAKSEEWVGITNSGDVAAWTHRIGNMVLLQKGSNSRLGNKPFSDKRTVLANSAFVLTAEVAQEEDWGPEEIDRRQRRLAKLAVATWPR